MEAVGVDGLLAIVQFLDVSSVLRLQRTAKSLRLPADFSEYVWRLLVLRRWNVRSEASFLRCCGVANWRNAYETLHIRAKHPKGAFFEKQNTVFAKGRAGGVYGWLTLAHTADNRIRRGEVRLRLCVQNVFNDWSALLLDKLAVSVKCHALHPESNSTYTQVLDVTAWCVLAKNGVRIKTTGDESPASLGRSEFLVVEAGVTCPRDMTSEVDFLTRADGVCFDFETSNFCWREENDVVRTHRLQLKFDDEHSILDQFTQLPGGVALLSGNPTDLF